MKILKRVSAVLLVMVLCFGLMSMSAFAASSSQEGLDFVLTTDKEEYGENEQIVATLTVTNTNEVSVTNVSMENKIPTGYMLAEDSESTKQVDVLEAGETATLISTYVRIVEPVTEPETTVAATEPATTLAATQPETGDSANIIFWCILLLISGGTVILIFSGKKKNVKSILSLVLCLTMAGAVFYGVADNAYAAETENKTMEISTTVNTGGNTVNIESVVNYTIEIEEETQEVISTLSGKICKASDRTTAIEGAEISIYAGSELAGTTTSDSNGNYYFNNLSAGQYYVEITSAGYIPFGAYVNVVENTTTYLETFLMIEGSVEDTGVASGIIYNALTGGVVEDVLLSIRKGWNNTENGDVVLTSTTDANGAYSVTLPIGNYTITATKDGFISTTINIVVQNGETPSQNGTMSPVISGDSFRIVLTWGENPRDLDSHVKGTLADGSSFHVYFNKKTAKDGDVEICKLDVDDTTSYGPETITLNTTTDAPYYYYIDRFAGTGTVASSEAQVKVYQGENLVAAFNVPTDQGDGTYWNVFAIVDGEMVIKNTITTSADTSYADTISETDTEAVTEATVEATTEAVTEAGTETVTETTAAETVEEATTVTEVTTEVVEATTEASSEEATTEASSEEETTENEAVTEESLEAETASN